MEKIFWIMWFRFNKTDIFYLFIYDKISRNLMKFIFISGHCSSYIAY